MSLIKRGTGSLLHGLAVVLDSVFEGIIAILETVVILAETLRAGVLQLLVAGGCLLVFLLMNPIGWLFLLQPEVLLFLFIIFGVPLLGRSFISLLKYGEYVTTEYLNDYADYLKTGKNRTFRSFGEYGRKYVRMEQEKAERAQRARREAEQRMWEERFRAWYQHQEQQSRYGNPYGRTGQGPYGGYGSYGQAGQAPPYTNPYDDFVKKYEESAKILGIPADTDEYQVRLAYRKLAKKVHPDINKAPDATQQFQKLSDAYDFMSKENIERYRSIKKGR